MEGQRFDFRCDYRDGLQYSAKYFCHVDDSVSSDHLIWTEKQDQWVREGRFSLYDNTSGAFFIVRVDKLTSEDSGTYWCGVNVNNSLASVIQLSVSQGTVTEQDRFVNFSYVVFCYAHFIHMHTIEFGVWLVAYS